MARIKGVDIPNNKRVEIALTYIYGIGRNLSKKILQDAKVNPDTKAITTMFIFEPQVEITLITFSAWTVVYPISLTIVFTKVTISIKS